MTEPDQIYRYDVAISFAGEDREVAERFANDLRRRGVRVFYDAWEQADLWGKNLYQHLDMVYRTAARYCVIFVSESYVAKVWTQHELRSAQARAFQEKSEYILPIKVDDSQLPGIPPTVGYLDSRNKSLSEICSLLIAKLGIKAEGNILEYLSSDDSTDRISALLEIAAGSLMEHFDRVVHCLLSDRSDTVRERAAWVLDNLNDPRAIPALLRAIHDPCWGVRSGAGWALVHLGESVRSEVEKILRESGNQGAREMALMILQRL